MGTRTLSVVQAAPGRRTPRTYEEIVRAIYNDSRAGHEARELLLAVAYAVHLAKTEQGVSPLREARRVLGRNSIGRPRYNDLVAADAPRYVPPREVEQHAHLTPCEAPRLRPYKPRPYKPRGPQPELPEPTLLRPSPPPVVHVMPGHVPARDWRTEDGVCGASSYRCVEEKDPRTGWVIAHWFCRRHAAHADRVAEQVRVQNEQAPEPVPNAGGLLPCYFKADWEKVYRHYARRLWEPPKYGLCADDWPTPGETFRAHRRLRMVFGGEPATDPT